VRAKKPLRGKKQGIEISGATHRSGIRRERGREKGFKVPEAFRLGQERSTPGRRKSLGSMRKEEGEKKLTHGRTLGTEEITGEGKGRHQGLIKIALGAKAAGQSKGKGTKNGSTKLQVGISRIAAWPPRKNVKEGSNDIGSAASPKKALTQAEVSNG